MTSLQSTPGNGRPVVPIPVAAVLVSVATLGLYWPAVHSGFVGDDSMILHRLRSLTSVADVLGFFRGEFFGFYRPLGFVSHALDWVIAGPNARQFHFTNLLLHGISALLVLLIGVRLSPRTPAGLWPSDHGGVVSGLLFP